jgi:hypothetical protein
MDQEQIEQIFLIYLRYSRKTHGDKHAEYSNIIISKFDYLYKVFFKDHNIYFSVYFNNLIKYFLPLPFELNAYSPVITYRKNVKDIFKQNNIDYYDREREVDKIKTNRKVDRMKRNKDMIKNEVDIGLNTYFINSEIYNQDSIFCIGIFNKMYIAKKFERRGSIIFFDKIYERKLVSIDIKRHMNSEPFEKINELWLNTSGKMEMTLDDIVYMSVLNKIEARDLFNVFDPISFDNDFIKHLFHYTGLPINKDKFKKMLECPTFFGTTPLLRDIHSVYYKDKKCLFYDVLSPLNDLLDLTSNIIVRNPFVGDDTKTGKFLKLDDIKNYYKNKKIPVVTDKRFRCLDLNPKFKKKEHCDTDRSSYYVGRRKLQEILYKTRKYMHQDIWLAQYDISKRIDSKLLENNIYHPKDIMKCNIYSYNYDAIILRDLNINGFWFTDYIDRISTGGEILIVSPLKYIDLVGYSYQKCFKKHLKYQKF